MLLLFYPISRLFPTIFIPPLRVLAHSCLVPTIPDRLLSPPDTDPFPRGRRARFRLRARARPPLRTQAATRPARVHFRGRAEAALGARARVRPGACGGAADSGAFVGPGAGNGVEAPAPPSLRFHLVLPLLLEAEVLNFELVAVGHVIAFGAGA